MPLLWDHVHPLVRDKMKKPAPKLGLEECHYVVVQIRFLSLQFTSSNDNKRGEGGGGGGTMGTNEFYLKNVGNVLLYKTMAYYQSMVRGTSRATRLRLPSSRGGVVVGGIRGGTIWTPRSEQKRTRGGRRR